MVAALPLSLLKVPLKTAFQPKCPTGHLSKACGLIGACHTRQCKSYALKTSNDQLMTLMRRREYRAEFHPGLTGGVEDVF